MLPIRESIDPQKQLWIWYEVAYVSLLCNHMILK